MFALATGGPDHRELAHQNLGHTDAARKAYQEALRLEPRFGWVKNSLLPGLEKGVRPFP
jgi:hypothetical protein